MKYLKIFEEFTFDKLEDYFLDLTESGKCHRYGNKSCIIYKCDTSYNRVQSRLDRDGIEYGFIDIRTDYAFGKGGYFLFISKEVMKYLDVVFGDSKLVVSDNSGDYYLPNSIIVDLSKKYDIGSDSSIANMKKISQIVIDKSKENRVCSINSTIRNVLTSSPGGFGLLHGTCNALLLWYVNVVLKIDVKWVFT